MPWKEMIEMAPIFGNDVKLLSNPPFISQSCDLLLTMPASGNSATGRSPAAGAGDNLLRSTVTTAVAGNAGTSASTVSTTTCVGNGTSAGIPAASADTRSSTTGTSAATADAGSRTAARIAVAAETGHCTAASTASAATDVGGCFPAARTSTDAAIGGNVAAGTGVASAAADIGCGFPAARTSTVAAIGGNGTAGTGTVATLLFQYICVSVHVVDNAGRLVLRCC